MMAKRWFFSASSLALTHGLVVSTDGIREDTLFIDVRRGRFIKEEQARKPVEVNLEGYMLFPGLINAHDHLELNHFPRTRFREVYPNAHLWGEDVSARLNEPPFRALRNYPLWDRCFMGGLKNLLSGATTVAHHNPLHRPLQAKNFPVSVVQAYGWAHSLHFETPAQIQKSYQSTPRQVPWMIHLAEGTDAVAAGEMSQLRKLGVMGKNTVLVHGVGIGLEDTRLAIEDGASMVWCPSTNQYLLGKTADVRAWAEAGRVALGSDSRLTADGDLLDELRAAYATTQLDEATLFRLVTEYPRRMLALGDVGSLEPGNWADMIALPHTDNPYQALTGARRSDLSLVMRRGKVMVADAAMVNRFPAGQFAVVWLDEKPKQMAKSLVEQVQRCQLKEAGLDI